MHYAGILVIVEPTDHTAAAASIEQVPGVEIHHSYPEEGKFVVVLETETLEDQRLGLENLQALHQVRMAGLVNYRDAPEVKPTDP